MSLIYLKAKQSQREDRCQHGNILLGNIMTRFIVFMKRKHQNITLYNAIEVLHNAIEVKVTHIKIIMNVTVITKLYLRKLLMKEQCPLGCNFVHYHLLPALSAYEQESHQGY